MAAGQKDHPLASTAHGPGMPGTRSCIVVGLCTLLCRNIMYGLEEEDGVPADQVPSQQDIEEAARCAAPSSHG